jgi:hypothetical protein
MGNPDRAFASSVDLDVEYGIDLIEATPKFVEKEDALYISLRFYQAKARVAGLSDEDIRAEADRYRPRMQAAERDLVHDDGWFLRKEVDPILPSLESFDLDDILDMYDVKNFDRMKQVGDDASPYERFAQKFSVWGQAEAIARILDDEKYPNPFKKPEIVFNDNEVLYLVDSQTLGRVTLTQKKAETLGLPEQRQPEAAAAK